MDMAHCPIKIPNLILMVFYQVPEQPEYDHGEEAVLCAQATINNCEKVPKRVCHTEVQRANLTATEIEQKCEREPNQGSARSTNSPIISHLSIWPLIEAWARDLNFRFGSNCGPD